jgi:hypothetical protein
MWCVDLLIGRQLLKNNFFHGLKNLGSAEGTVLLGCDALSVDVSQHYEGSWCLHLQESSNPRKTEIFALKVTETLWIEILGT